MAVKETVSGVVKNGVLMLRAAVSNSDFFGDPAYTAACGCIPPPALLSCIDKELDEMLGGVTGIIEPLCILPPATCRLEKHAAISTS